MAFTIISNDLAAYPAIQSVWYTTGIDILAAGLGGEGILSGCAVTPQGSPNMTIAVAAGVLQHNGLPVVAIANLTLAIGAANALLYRIDLIKVDPTTGIVAVVVGTAAVHPKPPDLVGIGLAFVLIPPAVTAITAAFITDSRAIILALSAGGGGGSGLTELLTGDSRDFVTTIGSWAAGGTGTTIVFDNTGSIGIDATHGAAKLHTTVATTASLATVTVSGLFKAGQLYHALVILKHAVLTLAQITGYQLKLGAATVNFGFGGPTNLLVNALPTTRSVAVIVPWVPGVDTTNPSLTLSRNTTPFGPDVTGDLWIEQARVVSVPRNSIGLAGPTTLGLPSVAGGTQVNLPYADSNYLGLGWPGVNSIVGFQLSNVAAQLLSPVDALGNGTYVISSTYAAYIYGRQSVIGRRSGAPGLNIEVGPDYVGWNMTERSVAETEIVPDGDYDVFLLDGNSDAAVKHWWHEEADGAYKAGAGRKSRIGNYFQTAFHIVGVQTVGNDKNEPGEFWQMPFPAEIDEVRVHVGTAPTGAALIVDVNINGVTIFTTIANRPTVAIAATDATSGAPDTTKFVKDDRLSVDLDQVGSTIAGSDVTVMVRGRYLW